MNNLKLILLLIIASLASATGYAQISGPDTLCFGPASLVTYTCPLYGTWSSSNPTAVAIDVVTGHVTTTTPGTATITFTISVSSGGGFYTKDVTVVYPPSLFTSESPAPCSNTCTLFVSGAATYIWTPSTGLSCTTCASPIVTICGIGAYTVNATDATGCTASAVVSPVIDYIQGHITFSGTPPASPSLKVWLIQFNPADSSITATDSVTTCMDVSDPYFEFAFKPAGNYLLKAKLIGTTPGTSGYIPTYSTSTPYWYSAGTITHAVGTTDLHNIDMVYGTVPSGPGFISGYVYTGAGKGTAGIPAVGMLIYLKNTSGQILTYTYTDAAGLYSFGSVAYGSYVIYPEEHRYYTTPSPTITLSAGTPSVTNTDFKQYTTSRRILPYTAPTSVFGSLAENTGVDIYPNPTSGHATVLTGLQIGGMATISLTDMIGRAVYSGEIQINNKGQGDIDLSNIPAGTYILRMTSQRFSYTGKVTRQE